MASDRERSDQPSRPERVVAYRPAGESTAWTPEAFSAFGMWLFLIALFMLFAAMLVAYLIIRIGGHQSPALHTVVIPKLLYLSTITVLGVSAAMSLAVHHIRLAHTRKSREWLFASLLLALGFVMVQTPALVKLLRFHHEASQAEGIYVYGLIFFLVLTHALHVVGGVVALIWTYIQSQRAQYSEANYGTIRNTALYWHFLDFIWICMFVMFLATG